MKKKRHTTEEIIRILRKADEGQTVEEVCREVNISEQTFYRWRRKYGRMEMAEAKRFKELENENSELKKMLAVVEGSLQVAANGYETSRLRMRRGARR